MNKFNNSVKQNNKTIFAIVMSAIVALILCIATSVTVGYKIAEATPDSLQETLDQTSCAYFDALAAQEEAQAKVNEAQATIEQCEREIPLVQGKLSARARSMYMNKSFGEIIDLLLGATSIENLVNNIQYINTINNKDAALVQSCKDLKAQVETEKASLDANLAEATNQANIAENAYNAAQAAIAAARAQEEEHSGGGGGGGGGGGYLPPETGNAIADRALGEQGKPYIWGAVGPAGYDCSGLVSYAVSGAHTRLGTTTTFMGWPRLDSPVTGCVCTHSSHCGIYISGGTMCHAPQEGQTVCCTGVQGGMIYVSPPY